jgi:general secretion pathway protein K
MCCPEARRAARPPPASGATPRPLCRDLGATTRVPPRAGTPAADGRSAAPLRPGRIAGYALLLVLWFLLALTFAIASAALHFEHTTDTLLRYDEKVRNDLSAYSTQQAVLYLLATRRLSIGGLPVAPDLRDYAPHLVADDMAAVSLWPRGDELRLDDTVYRGLGAASFSLQDSAGLVSPNYRLSEASALLNSLASAEQVPVLVDQLLDYLDDDDLRRLQGAESDAYRERAVAGPANRRLLTAEELLAIPAWRDLLMPAGSSVAGGPLSLFSAFRYTPLNLNTAPVEVLAALPGMSRQAADALVAERRLVPLSGLGRVRFLTQSMLAADPDDVIFYPSRFLRLRIWPGPGTQVIETVLELSPTNPEGTPWRIHKRIRHDAPRAHSASQPAWEAFQADLSAHLPR